MNYYNLSLSLTHAHTYRGTHTHKHAPGTCAYFAARVRANCKPIHWQSLPCLDARPLEYIIASGVKVVMVVLGKTSQVRWDISLACLLSSLLFSSIINSCDHLNVCLRIETSMIQTLALPIPTIKCILLRVNQTRHFKSKEKQEQRYCCEQAQHINALPRTMVPWETLYMIFLIPTCWKMGISSSTGE